MTHPLTNALAMRTAAAAHCKAHADDHPHIQRGMEYSDGYLDGCLNASNAILALPLEADHAALVAEAVKLDEIKGLIAVVRYYADGIDHFSEVARAALQPFIALETP